MFTSFTEQHERPLFIVTNAPFRTPCSSLNLLHTYHTINLLKQKSLSSVTTISVNCCTIIFYVQHSLCELDCHNGFKNLPCNTIFYCFSLLDLNKQLSSKTRFSLSPRWKLKLIL